MLFRSPDSDASLPLSPALPWAAASADTGAFELSNYGRTMFAPVVASQQLGPRLGRSDVTTAAPPRACGHFTHDAVTITSTRQAARRVLPLPPALRAALVELESREAALAVAERAAEGGRSCAGVVFRSVESAAAAKAISEDNAAGNNASALTHFDALVLKLMLDLQAKYSLPVSFTNSSVSCTAATSSLSHGGGASTHSALEYAHQSSVRLLRRTGMSLTLLLAEGAFAADDSSADEDDGDAFAAMVALDAPDAAAYPWLPRWARLTPAAPLLGCAAVPHLSLAREPFWLPHLSALRRLYRGALERATFAVDEGHRVTALMADAYTEIEDGASPTGVLVACTVPARARLAALFDAMLLNTVLAVRVAQAAAGTLRLRYRSRVTAPDAGLKSACCCTGLTFCPAALVTHTLAEGALTSLAATAPTPFGCRAAASAHGSGPAPWVTDALFSLLAPHDTSAGGDSCDSGDLTTDDKPARLAAISAAAAQMLKAEHEYPEWMPGMAPQLPAAPPIIPSSNNKVNDGSDDDANDEYDDFYDCIPKDTPAVPEPGPSDATPVSLASAASSVWVDPLTALNSAQCATLKWSDTLRSMLVMPPLATAKVCGVASTDSASIEDPWTEGLGLQLSTVAGTGAGDVGSVHIAAGLFGGEVPTGDATPMMMLPTPESLFAQVTAMHARTSAALGSTLCSDDGYDTVISLTDLLVDVWHTFGELRLLWQSGLVYPRDGDETLRGFPLPPETEKHVAEDKMNNNSDANPSQFSEFEFVASNAVFRSREAALAVHVPIVFSTCSKKSVQVAKEVRQSANKDLPAFELRMAPVASPTVFADADADGDSDGTGMADVDALPDASLAVGSEGCDCAAPVVVWRNTVELQRFLQSATEEVKADGAQTSGSGSVAAKWKWTTVLQLQGAPPKFKQEVVDFITFMNDTYTGTR